MFFRNAWAFRRELADYRVYDYHYNLSIFCRSLELTKEFLESDKTISEGTEENAQQIEQFIKDIHRFEHALEYSEAELGEEFPNDCYLDRSDERDVKIKVFIDKIQEVEHTSWNRAMDNLRNNMQGWWD
jgi:hypothetical protein